MISKRVQKMDASGIRKAFELSKKMKNPIDLSIGQPDFDVPQNVKDAAINAISAGYGKYSQTLGIDELRKAVARTLRRRKILNSRIDNVAISGAVSGGLSVVLPTLIDSGDEVIIFDPSFVGYKQLVLLFNGKPKFVKKKQDFSIDFKKLEKAVTKKTKVILFSTPENPTGYVYTEKEMRKLAMFAKKYGLVVISDEIYADFVYGKKHVSIGEFYDNTIVLGGFSKSHAMMGWRIGYMSAPEEVLQNTMKVQQFTFVCPPTPFQHASLEALRTSSKDVVRTYKRRRDFMYENLKDVYDIVKPDGAFYFYIKYPYDGERFVQRCLEHNLLVVPGSSFSEVNTHFRISYATGDDVLRKAVAILREVATG